MKCPIDNTELLMTERQGIEIDYCPNCRGVWLDRGELDKIIDRSTPAEPVRQAEAPRFEPRPEPRYEQGREDHRREEYHRKPYKKRDSFLGELFDF